MERSNEEKEIEDEAEQEILNFDRPDYIFEPKEQHDWRQQGPYLLCKSCEIGHATYVGINKIMVGLNEEGQPILESRFEG